MGTLRDKIEATIRKVATKLGEGRVAILQVRTAGTYDAATDSFTGATYVEYTFEIPPPTSRTRSFPGVAEVDNKVLRVMMPRTLNASGIDVVPTIGSALKLGTVVHEIVGVSPIEFGDGPAGYELEIRA